MNPFVHMAKIMVLGVIMSSSAWAGLERLPWPETIQPVGRGELTWFGLDVYEATLYAEQGRYDAQQPYALEIRYARAFSKAQLAERSIEEIQGIYGDLPQRAVWHQKLLNAMVDVGRGDTLTGVHLPGQKALFYRNQQPVSEIEDAELAARFFDIWLHEQTSEPELRAELLGRRQ